MIETVKELSESIEQNQLDEIRGILTEDQYELLEHALGSSTEKQAESRVQEFRASMDGTSHLTAVRIGMILQRDQRAIILRLMGL
jgi:hypothetical protein